MIQLSGGNDGLNTVIPYRNDSYFIKRPNLAISRVDTLDLNGEMGLNPGMAELKAIYDDGELCIINNVGYPNSNRSHFRSMDIWHSASNSDQYWSTGWLGRYLDSDCQKCKPYSGIEIDDAISLALRGDRQKGFSMSNPQKMNRAASNLQIGHHGNSGNDNLDFLYKTLIDTRETASYYLRKNQDLQVHTYLSSETTGIKVEDCVRDDQFRTGHRGILCEFHWV